MNKAIPSSDSIVSFTPRAFKGLIYRSADLGNYTDITSSLIETSPAHSVVSGRYLSIYVKWPGDSHANSEATLVFDVVYDGETGKKRFIWRKVSIQDLSGIESPSESPSPSPSA